MLGFNRIFLLGHLGNAPKVYHTKNGQTYAGFSLATNRFRHDSNRTEADNAWVETTDWHYVRVWGSQGDTCAKYLSKGQGVFVEGYLTQYSLIKENGETEKKVGINAIRVDFLPRTTESLEEPSTGS